MNWKNDKNEKSFSQKTGATWPPTPSLYQNLWLLLDVLFFFSSSFAFSCVYPSLDICYQRKRTIRFFILLLHGIIYQFQLRVICRSLITFICVHKKIYIHLYGTQLLCDITMWNPIDNDSQFVKRLTHLWSLIHLVKIFLSRELLLFQFKKKKKLLPFTCWQLGSFVGLLSICVYGNLWCHDVRNMPWKETQYVL